MSNLMELRQAAEYDRQNEMRNNPLYALASGLGKGFNSGIGEYQDQQRKQQNIKDQLSTYQQMMENMASMPDKSNIGKANIFTTDKLKQKRSGIIGSSTVIPTQEVSFDGSGINMRLGFKTATPADQKSLIDIQKTQEEMQRSERKRDFISNYISGDIPEGAFLEEMGNLELTPEEFESATAAKTRLQSIRHPRGTVIQSRNQVQPEQQITDSQGQDQQQDQVFDKYDQFGNPIYRPATPTEQKAQREMIAEDKANEIKTQGVIDSAQNAIDSIDELEKNIVYFGPIGGRAPTWLSPTDTKKIEWDANFNKLRGQNILNIISEMKNQSRTGATGFGQLNEKELKVIEDASMVLRKEMDEKTAQKYLTKMKNAFQKIIDREKTGYDFEKNNPNNLNNSKILTATNPTTGEKIQSSDGGKTWQAMQ